MYVNLNFSLKNWAGGVFGKWAPPHGTVVLMSRQHTGENLCETKTSTELPVGLSINWWWLRHKTCF